MNGMGVFWLVVLIVACVLYFAVAIVVTIKGAGDLKELFAGGTEEPPDDKPADGKPAGEAGT
ncbi:MAG: hypothetical protein JXB46_12075 [Candidatus Eisenbacteria bacterium]|nr:hypothetical protein [Candidatus Eisenbacteria bacterium]